LPTSPSDDDDLDTQLAARVLSMTGDPAFEWGHGGLRPGAGRKRKARRPNVVHRTRPSHAQRYPSHVTVPFLKVVGNLRGDLIFNTLRRIFQTPKSSKKRSSATNRSFQVVQYSVQKDHLHLVIEAADREAFSSGMRSLVIRTALRMNRLLKRKSGQVIRDRYHRRDLFDAKQVRTALRYVLLNAAKHGQVGPNALDPYSSAISFDGFCEVADEPWHRKARGDPWASPIKPWTKLLKVDWRELGLISPFEAARWH
jgi:putative transposase